MLIAARRWSIVHLQLGATDGGHGKARVGTDLQCGGKGQPTIGRQGSRSARGVLLLAVLNQGPRSGGGAPRAIFLTRGTPLRGCGGADRIELEEASLDD